MPALSPAQLIAALVLWQNAQTPNFHWSAEELRAFEATLKQGDLFVRKRNGMEITWQRGHAKRIDKENEHGHEHT
jgi:hypothetical protein